MSKTALIALLGWVVILFGGCAKGNSVPTTPEERISAALQELLKRDDAPFAVIEHSASGKFVQFTGSEEDPLVLDLPFPALKPDERSRAQQLFASLGGRETEYGFEFEVGRDPEAATRIALRVLREVYELPEDSELSVRVGS